MSAALSPNDVAMLDAMTDPNILAHIAASDSSEVAISQPFVTTAQSDAVRAFAQALVTDHSKALEMARAAAQQASITPQASPADSMQLRMMPMMQSRIQAAPLGAERDRVFVNVQVMHHQHALSELQTLRNVASNAAVRAQIDSEIPVVQSHLDKARELLQTVGASSNGMNMNMGTSPPPTTTPPSNPPTTSNPPEE